jgi:hypothetical protein
MKYGKKFVMIVVGSFIQVYKKCFYIRNYKNYTNYFLINKIKYILNIYNFMNSVEYFQQEQLNNAPIPSIDMNFVILNRFIKYILNFLLIYLFLTTIIYNFPDTNIHIFIILICTISSIVFYALDLNFPSCYV